MGKYQQGITPCQHDEFRLTCLSCIISMDIDVDAVKVLDRVPNQWTGIEYPDGSRAVFVRSSATGQWHISDGGGPPYDSATATGMYDLYDG